MDLPIPDILDGARNQRHHLFIPHSQHPREQRQRVCFKPCLAAYLEILSDLL